jgi:putative restriction endonuclease
MTKGVFTHRADTHYDDFPEERYQFPGQYLKRARSFAGDWIVYYEPRRGGGRLGYTAIAKVADIVADPAAPDMFIARIEPGSYLELEAFVPLKKPGGFMESDLKKADGSVNRGAMGWAIRPISDADFNAIVLAGFPDELQPLPRLGAATPAHPPGMAEEGAEFLFDFERQRVEQVTTRPFRDRAFRRIVLDAYDSRCAITGLKLINGGGRAEVEAAHIKPVEHSGPDTIRNGLALSGTVHWMFDRGLISLSDDLDILVSRHVNDPDRIWGLVNATGKALPPANPAHRPHPRFLGWHREQCFKG